MIKKTQEIYMCNLTVRNVKIWYEIHYDYIYDQTEVMITYDVDWFQDYDSLFNTCKGYKDYNELKELIISDIKQFNKTNNISNTIINTTDIEFSLIYN